MGGQSSSNSQTTSNSAPWAPAMPEVQGLLSGVQGQIGNTGLTPTQGQAIGQLTQAGEAGNPFAPANAGAVQSLLTGGGAMSQAPTAQGAYTGLQSNLSPYLDPNYSTINSPAVQSALQQVQSDVTNQVNGQFAAGGRTGSAANSMALGRGIAQGEAPIIMNQANTDTANRIGAANTVYGAGNQTAGTIAGFGQNQAANQAAGINSVAPTLSNSLWGPQTAIQAQSLLSQIPASNLGMLAQIGIPLAQLGQTSNGTSNGTQTASPAQQFGQIASGFGSLGTGLFGNQGAVKGLFG